MTPEQVSALETSLTPTAERPTKPGDYRLSGDNWLPRFVNVWRNQIDGKLYTNERGGVRLDREYDSTTWTGPIDLAAMLEAIGQWRIDVEDGMEKNERLREAMVALLEDAEDIRDYTHDWDWKHGARWDKDLAKAREVLAAALKPADTIVTAPAGLIEAGQKVTREAAEAEKGSEP